MKKLALTISLGGILILLLLVNFQETKRTEIQEINEKNINKIIKIQGTSENIKKYGNSFTTFYISNNSTKIQIICNCPIIKENQKLEITGKLTKYKKNLQITADKIKIIS
jgi:RecJ-like exonuclease